MTEVWKDVNGYEGLYQVSTLGNVKSLNYSRTRKERNLIPALKKGYLSVQLCKEVNVKEFRIQQLVADAFISNPNGYKFVNHKDENKQNNCVDNLEWCDTKYNCNYGTRNKRIAEKRSIAIYCVELDKVFQSTREVERITGIANSSISKCCKGKLKSAGGYHWEYVK